MEKQQTKQHQNTTTFAISFISGLVFGLGLIISMMVQPEKVIGFLDVFGQWDPSLGFVMGGAIVIAMPSFWLAKRWQQAKKTAYNGEPMQLPSNTQITKPLIIGSVLFGMGWGLVGLCPGPALVVAATGNTSALVFIGAMFVGFKLWVCRDIRKIS